MYHNSHKKACLNQRNSISESDVIAYCKTSRWVMKMDGAIRNHWQGDCIQSVSNRSDGAYSVQAAIIYFQRAHSHRLLQRSKTNYAPEKVPVIIRE